MTDPSDSAESDQPTANEEQGASIIDIIRALDESDGPVRLMLEALVGHIRAGRKYSWLNTLAIYGVILFIICGFWLLTWYEKIDNDVLMLLIGLLIGLLSNHIRNLFPVE